jgi:hypothetical protein
MLLRVLYLIALIGVVGGDARASSATEESEVRVGGEGFGNIVMLAVIVGALVLVAIIVIAALALSGQFENDVVNPRV